jgi:hypothetical protein
MPVFRSHPSTIQVSAAFASQNIHSPGISASVIGEFFEPDALVSNNVFSIALNKPTCTTICYLRNKGALRPQSLISRCIAWTAEQLSPNRGNCMLRLAITLPGMQVFR